MYAIIINYEDVFAIENYLNEIKLDKNTPIPLYYQLKSKVLALIKESRLREGDTLPPESEFCEALDISRPTVRQALNELVSEGYLNRYKGRGTFVSKPKVEEGFFSKLESFNNEMRSKNMTPHTRVLALEKRTGPNLSQAVEKLNLPMDSTLIYLSRLRSADNVPLVYVETYISYERYARLMDVDFGNKSLYDSLRDLYNVNVNHVRREIEAVNSRRKEAGLLKITVGKAIHFVKTVAYDDSLGFPVEFSVARYSGELNKFTLDVYR